MILKRYFIHIAKRFKSIHLLNQPLLFLEKNMHLENNVIKWAMLHFILKGHFLCCYFLILCLFLNHVLTTEGDSCFVELSQVCHKINLATYVFKL